MRIIETVAIIKTSRFENGIVPSPTVKPSVEAGASIDLNSPPQVNPTMLLIRPSKPRVAMTGATTAAGPEVACLKSTRIKK